MRLEWFEEAWEDYVLWEGSDKRILKKVNELIKDSMRNGYGGLGKPEPLRGDLAGYWSKRIDATNRLVYRIEGNVLTVLSCRTHYER